MGKGNLFDKMKKVGLIGVLLLHQVKSSSGCHPHVNLVKEEEKCMKDLQLLMSHKATENISVHCKGMWDDLNCWPPASLEETVSQPCPDFFDSEGKVERNCTANGWTDLLVPHEDACGYTFNETLQFLGESSDSHLYFSYVKTMYTVGYTLSLISLTIAIAIFCLFRKLHCTRNYIHIQLFISFILRAIFIFVRDAHLNEELYHCDYYPVTCKVVLMFSNYSILANYSWLLAEGHFLFTLVSRSFFSLKKHLAWYIVLSWGLPLIVIVSWGCAKYFYEDEGCWETRRHEWIWWILRVPVLLTISMNLIFFLGILGILVSKLRMPDAQRSEFSQYKRLIKSTFFLVALFGLHYILFVFLPVQVSSSVFKIWTFAELALSSTQGFVVAVLYCFMNGEVQHEIQRRWKRWRLTQPLPSRRRQQHGSISHSGSPHTQVSLLPCSPGSPTTSGLPVDTVEM
ncbi:secretin receptor [Stegastes partitus]|uniref:Secretin receptor n=1 Tax=Stegastes partitus TaxID=144197 RepID=A0A9Y4K0F2_9TELE|nr:PREDICTED: secretin receptor-like [Stegastes partitus]